MTHRGSARKQVTNWTPEMVRALGVRTDVTTANSILGLTKSPGYELLKQGRYPVPVLRAGHKYVVPVAGLLAALGLSADAHPDRQLTA